MASVASIMFFLSLIEPVMDDKLTAPRHGYHVSRMYAGCNQQPYTQSNKPRLMQNLR